MRCTPKIEGSLLVSPPGWPVHRDGKVLAWPPPLEEARRAVSPAGRRVRLAHYPARHIVLACSIAVNAKDDADLYAAYRILVDVSNLRGEGRWKERRRGLRAIAAANAAVVLASLGHLGALLVAKSELAHAMPYADEVRGLAAVLLSAAQAIDAGIASLLDVARLEWIDQGTTALLRPLSESGRQRIRDLPGHSFDGTWNGLARLLQMWGLQAVNGCPLPDPVRLCPTDEDIVVTRYALPAA